MSLLFQGMFAAPSIRFLRHERIAVGPMKRPRLTLATIDRSPCCRSANAHSCPCWIAVRRPTIQSRVPDGPIGAPFAGWHATQPIHPVTGVYAREAGSVA